MNKRIRTSIVAAGILAGTALGAASIGGVANAQTDETVTTEETAEAPEHGRRHHFRLALEEIAEVIGVDVEEVRDTVREGTPLGDLAEANGVDSGAVVDVIVENKQERIAQAVENGRITQEQADERLEGLEERVTTRVEEGRPEGAEGPRGPRGPRGDRPEGAPDGPPADAPVDAES